MKWAIAQRWRLDNPTDAITEALPRQDLARTHRKALHYSEVSKCISAVCGSHASESTKLAFELLVLTAARSSEIRLAKWDEFDVNAAVWTVPANRMKMKREHRVPLSTRAVELLSLAEHLTDGSGLVFPGTRKRKPLSDMTLSKLIKELNFDADVHGFRTSFRTWAQEQTNISREVAEAALAHTARNKTERAYARSDLFEKRREMMSAWATYLSSS